VDDDLSVSKSDLRMTWMGDRVDLETGFLYLDAAPSENRLDDTTEWALDATWRFDPNWSAKTNWRYDFDAGRATIAGIGLGFQTECLSIDLSLSRRFTSSTSVRPTTDFGLSVELAGFGTGGEGGAPRRRCVAY
jgi:LPS-assembly protein